MRVLIDRFGVSQRRVPAPKGSIEGQVRDRLRRISAAHPRWGWRKAYWILRAEGLVVNHKRVRSYWCDEGLKRPARARKKQRIGPQRGQRLTVQVPDQMWALDFQVDVTADGRPALHC